MNIMDFKVTEYSFTGIVLKGKLRYQLSGTFKTSFQDYPEDKETPLYASTVKFTLLDNQGKIFDGLTESENQELEEVLDEAIDSILESESEQYSR